MAGEGEGGGVGSLLNPGAFIGGPLRLLGEAGGVKFWPFTILVVVVVVEVVSAPPIFLVVILVVVVVVMNSSSSSSESERRSMTLLSFGFGGNGDVNCFFGGGGSGIIGNGTAGAVAIVAIVAIVGAAVEGGRGRTSISSSSSSSEELSTDSMFPPAWAAANLSPITSWTFLVGSTSISSSSKSEFSEN